MGRPPGTRSSRPSKPDLIDGIDVAERRLMEMVGRSRNGIRAKVRDEIAEIAAPLHALLRPFGRRNGPLPTEEGE